VAKKKWVRASVLLLVAAVAAGILAGCGSSSSSTSSSTASSSAALDIALQAQLPASIRQSGVITVATDVPYVPFEQFLSDGKTVTGLDVDLMNAIEPILGVKFQINNTAYANIIPALEAKRYDIGWSAISVGSLGGTSSANFLVYISPTIASLVVSSSNNSIKTESDVCGTTLGFLFAEKSASVTQLSKQCVAEGKEPITIKYFQKVPDIILAVESGQVTGRVVHEVNGAYFVSQSQGKLKLVRNVLPPQPLPMGVAIPADQPGLQAAIKGALQTIIDNGTYAAVLAKYGATTAGVKTITVKS